MDEPNVNIEKLILMMAEYRGEVKAFKDILDRTMERDRDQYKELTTAIREINTSLNELLIREAKREGEFTGVKRSAIIASGGIALIVSILGLIATVYV